jgi:hypothetical protein
MPFLKPWQNHRIQPLIILASKQHSSACPCVLAPGAPPLLFNVRQTSFEVTKSPAKLIWCVPPSSYCNRLYLFDICPLTSPSEVSLKDDLQVPLNTVSTYTALSGSVAEAYPAAWLNFSDRASIKEPLSRCQARMVRSRQWRHSQPLVTWLFYCLRRLLKTLTTASVPSK